MICGVMDCRLEVKDVSNCVENMRGNSGNVINVVIYQNHGQMSINVLKIEKIRDMKPESRVRVDRGIAEDNAQSNEN